MKHKYKKELQRGISPRLWKRRWHVVDFFVDNA